MQSTRRFIHVKKSEPVWYSSKVCAVTALKGVWTLFDLFSVTVVNRYIVYTHTTLCLHSVLSKSFRISLVDDMTNQKGDWFRETESLTYIAHLIHLSMWEGVKHWRVVILIYNLDSYVNFFLCMAAITEWSNTWQLKEQRRNTQLMLPLSSNFAGIFTNNPNIIISILIIKSSNIWVSWHKYCKIESAMDHSHCTYQWLPCQALWWHEWIQFEGQQWIRERDLGLHLGLPRSNEYSHHSHNPIESETKS